MANTWGTLTWGINSWGEQSDVSISVTGTQLSTSQGDVTTTVELNSGWGRELGWGTLDWGNNSISTQVPITGSQLNLDLGDTTLDLLTIASPTGVTAAFALSSVDASPDAMASGNQIPLSLGDAIGSCGSWYAT